MSRADRLHWLPWIAAAACAGSPTGASRAAVVVPSPTFMHAGFGAGPALYTDAGGHLLEERRSEPFGQPIDVPDVAARDLNELGKRSDPATGWSDHGARWLAPAAARWLTPDPPIAGPAGDAMAAPWALNPYQYVDQNPIVYWDPDGRQPALTDDQIRRGITARMPVPFLRDAALDLLHGDGSARTRAAYRKTAEDIATGKLTIHFDMDMSVQYRFDDGWRTAIDPANQHTFMWFRGRDYVMDGSHAFLDSGFYTGDITRLMVEANHQRLLDDGRPYQDVPLTERFAREADSKWTSRGIWQDDPATGVNWCRGATTSMKEFKDAYAKDPAFKKFANSYVPMTLGHVDNMDDKYEKH